MKDVIIADDHPIFRAGLRQIVEDEGYRVVAEASDGMTCTSSAEITHPDIVILDLAMPGMDGYDVLAWLRKNQPDAIAVVVSMHSSKVFAQKAKELGARAFVAKEDAASEIYNALTTPAGVFYLSASVGGDKQMAPEISDTESIDIKLLALTKAERRIFEMVGQSLTNHKIAERLNVSHRTVQTHRTNISKKLDLTGHNRLYELAILCRNRQQ